MAAETQKTPRREEPAAQPAEENREQLLNEVLLHVAAQLRTALGGMHIAVGRLAPAARRAAAGALEHLPVAQVTNLAHALDSAEEAGLTIYGAGGAPGPNSLDAFADNMRLPAVLVLGNEDKGLRPGVAKRCAHMLRIPLARPFDSLNVAQAGAVLLGLAAAARSRGSVV